MVFIVSKERKTSGHVPKPGPAHLFRNLIQRRLGSVRIGCALGQQRLLGPIGHFRVQRRVGLQRCVGFSRNARHISCYSRSHGVLAKGDPIK